MSLSVLDRAAGYATCSILSSAGGTLVGVGVASLAAGGTGIVPLTLGSLSLLAAGAACTDTPVGPAEPNQDQTDGCTAIANGVGQLQFKSPTSQNLWVNASDNNFYPSNDRCLSITRAAAIELSPGNWQTIVEYETLDGSKSFTQSGVSEDAAKALFWRLEPIGAATCDGSTGLPPSPEVPPVQYTDPQTNCNYQVTLQGWVQEIDGGPQSPVFKIEAGATSLNTGGGIVGGCNFEPVIYYGGPNGPGGPGGGGPTIGPWNPDWGPVPTGGTPPWLDFVAAAAGGAAGVAATNALNKLFEAKYPAGNRTITAACDYKEDGTPETFTVNYPEEPYQDRVLTALDAITDFQQQILLWKTPTCSATGPGVTGDPVTINFESKDYSPFGNDRLRKRFVYFDQSGSTLEQTTDHWRDFVWQAGGVAVFCKGTLLGKPQVWAATEDEGKRVINHAAAITGADMSKAEWIITSSKDPRYGVSGEMHVMKGKNGTFGITKRGKTSGSPPALAPIPTLGSG